MTTLDYDPAELAEMKRYAEAILPEIPPEVVEQIYHAVGGRWVSAINTERDVSLRASYTDRDDLLACWYRTHILDVPVFSPEQVQPRAAA